nr:uncharacterized protein LOC109756107 [Aegilops tauschii subsp. strangulata]
MDVDIIIGETAKDAAAEAARAAADEAAKGVHEETAKGSAGGGKKTDDHTDSIPSTGALGATPIPEPPVAAPTEGETFDEEVIAAAGLKIVDELRASSSGSKEDQLLQAMSDNFQKLQALHRTRKEKLDSRATVVEAAEVDFQKRVEQTQVWFAEAWQELRTGPEQLSQSWDELLLKQSDIEKAQEEAAQQAAAEDARLRERCVGLDAHEEDLAAREEALAAKLRGKDQEIENLVMQRTQELEQEHKKTLEALVLDHTGKLKETINAAEAAEAAKNELAGKVKKLEADLEDHGKEILMLKGDREKTLYDLAEMQTTISEKTKKTLLRQ